jgi:DNA-binding transcriptional MocR family regulator
MWTPKLTASSSPKYAALAQAIAQAVRAGELLPGTRLPPQRTIARRLKMNLSTVSKAYDLAAEMGVVAGEVGRGTFVRMSSAPERIPWPKTGGPGALDLSSSFPLPSVAREELGQAFAALNSLPFSTDLLRYHPASAHPAHLAAGAAWMGLLGVETTPERVLMTSGAIHGVFVSLLAIARPGDLILLEELSSPAIIGACRTLGLRVMSLPLDQHGIRPDTLETIAARERPKAMIIVPHLQNPTLGILPEERRRQIAETARKHNLIIIEDDVYGPLLKPAERGTPLTSLVPERSCFCTSLSKSVAPGLRVGFLLVPPALRTDTLNAIRVSTWMTSPLLGQIAANWILDGTAKKLVERQRATTGRRQAIARRVLKGFDIVSHDAGLHVLLRLPEPWRADQFAAHMQGLGVTVLPSSEMSADPGGRQNLVRLSLCAVDTEDALQSALQACRTVLLGG